MKNIYLRLWFLSALTFFFIAAPTIILYSNGYTYDWQKKSIQLTGVLYLKSYPRNATIFLNNKEQGSTPLQISHLIPGDYDIRIEKEGYHSWQKKLTVNSGYTTFAEDVTLFKSQPISKLLAPGEIKNTLISPDQKILASLAIDNNQQILYLYQTSASQAKVAKTYKLDDKIELISWSASSQHLLLKINRDLFILNVANSKLQPIPKLKNLKVQTWKWDYYNDHYLFGLNTLSATNHQIVRLDLDSNLIKNFGPVSVLSFAQWKNQLYAINPDNGHLYLTTITEDNQTNILELPKSKYYFHDITGNYLALFDENNQAAYILNPSDSKKPLLTWFRTDGRMQWHNGGLLYLNNDELWVYYPNSNQNILVERLSQPIDQGLWHPASATIITRQNSELKVYELDSRDHRVVTTLLTITDPNNNPIIAQPKGDLLILSTSVDNKPGLYSVEIQ